MNLVDYMEFGGPGSGRRPGYGVNMGKKQWDKMHGDAFNNAAQVLKNRGYKDQGDYPGGTRMFTHPDGHEVHLRRQGAGGVTWDHSAGGYRPSGMDVDSLREYLDALHRR